MRLAGLRRDSQVQLNLLRKAGHGRLDRPPWYLAALVEIQGAILGAQDLLHSLLVVQSGDPDLRPVRQVEVKVGLVEPVPQRREAQLEHLRHGVCPDAGLGVVEPEPEDDMPTARRVDGALDDGANEEERLARARSAAEHDVAGGAGE